MTAPLVAIGLPVYNGEPYLAQTLEDLSAQTLEDFVVVVCDNASTDATAEIVREHASRDRRFRYVGSETNAGALVNFNKAFRVSPPAPYFAWSAHDDRHAPDFLERLVGRLEATPGAGLAYGRAVYVDDDGERIPYDSAHGCFVTPDGHRYFDDRALERDVDEAPHLRFERVLLSTMVNTPVHGVFRRSVLENTSLHQYHGSDQLLLVETALQSTFCFEDADLFEWRLHRGGTTYMPREEWIKRETGQETVRYQVPLRSLAAYAGAVRRARLPRSQALRAYSAIARYAVHPDKLRRIGVYFGLQEWHWTPGEPAPAEPSEAREAVQTR